MAATPSARTPALMGTLRKNPLVRRCLRVVQVLSLQGEAGILLLDPGHTAISRLHTGCVCTCWRSSCLRLRVDEFESLASASGLNALLGLT